MSETHYQELLAKLGGRQTQRAWPRPLTFADAVRMEAESIRAQAGRHLNVVEMVSR